MVIAPIVVSMLVAHMAPLAHFIELSPSVLRLPAVLAMLADRLIQILLRFLYIPTTALILISMSRNRCPS
jgi:hypothetical protein